MAKDNKEVTLDTELEDFIVTLSAKSMSEMGADRYWELHVQAKSEEEAIKKAKEATATWTIYDTQYGILREKWRAAPEGSIAYREI